MSKSSIVSVIAFVLLLASFAIVAVRVQAKRWHPAVGVIVLGLVGATITAADFLILDPKSSIVPIMLRGAIVVGAGLMVLLLTSLLKRWRQRH